MLFPLILSIFLSALVGKANELQTLEVIFSQGKISRNDYLDRLFELRAEVVESEFGKGKATPIATARLQRLMSR
jgi:hypothetical protein